MMSESNIFTWNMNISVNFQFLNPFILVDYQQHIIIKLDLNREKVVIVLHGRQL